MVSRWSPEANDSWIDALLGSIGADPTDRHVTVMDLRRPLGLGRQPTCDGNANILPWFAAARVG
jgi:hypothetical protein